MPVENQRYWHATKNKYGEPYKGEAAKVLKKRGNVSYYSSVIASETHKNKQR